MHEFLSNYMAEWMAESIAHSLKILPFLFFVFLFIEVFEIFFANKFRSFLKHSKKEGPVLGALLASIPQCGFSIIASTLYSERFISRGTIIAVYLATSDEAVPVLLMYPEFAPYIVPLVIVKLLIAIPVGYLVDLSIRGFNKPILNNDTEEGAIKIFHRHNFEKLRKRDVLIHPIKHTINVFAFILLITMLLNYLMVTFDIASIFKGTLSFLTPLFASLIGLIPNCAISVALVLMFVKGTISFGAMIAGLLTAGGIGVLILCKNNKSKRDTAFILTLLVLIGYIFGLLIQTFWG